MKGRNFPSENQAHLIYKDLRESYTWRIDELNILRLAIDVLDIFQLSDVYQIKIYVGSSFFARFVKHSCAAKCNFVAE